MTLTYLMPRSNLLPNAFDWDFFFFEKLVFIILLRPKKVFSLDMFNLMPINKFQRSRLTFDLSAKVAHIGVPSTYLNIVFSQTTWPIEIKFHMATPYD